MKKNKTIHLFLILFFLLFSCGSPKTNNAENPETDSISNYSDTVAPSYNEDNMGEDLDLLMDKYEDPDRSKWQNPEMVLNKLGSLEGKVIADIGSGTGYFTFPLAEDAKKVIAIDIEPQFLEYIEEQKIDYPVRVSDAIETRLTVEDEPRIEKEEVDMVLMVNVYSYLQNRVEYLKEVRYGLKDGGVILIVDFKLGDMPVGPSEDLKVSQQNVIEELKEAEFDILESDTTVLKYQYLIKAKK